jgi:hypothetical protein
MHPHRLIPLRRCPPPSLHRTQDGLLSDEYSDFPSIRERKSSSEAPIRVPSHHRRYSSTVQKDPERRRPPNQSESSPQPPRRPRLPNTGLGGKNILNAIEASVQHAQVSIEHFLDDYANN